MGIIAIIETEVILMKKIELDLNGFRNYIIGKKIICYGAGVAGIRAIDIMENWKKSGDIIAFVDKDKAKLGKTIGNGRHFYRIISMNDVIRFADANTVMLITCMTNSTDLVALRKDLDSYSDLNEMLCLSLVEISQRQLLSSDYGKIEHNYLKTVIPRKIHYCWIGGEKPSFIKAVINSWNQACPDYEIIEWNERNYDFTKEKYMKQAYEAKAWGFVPDYARLDIIYNEGGIYLDTDVRILKQLDELLYQDNFFISDASFMVNLGSGFGAVQGSFILKEFMDYYDDISFQLEDGRLNKLPCILHQYEVLKKYGVQVDDQFQKLQGINIYPMVLGGTNIYSMQIRKSAKAFFAHYGTMTWVDNETFRNRKKMQSVFLHEELENYDIGLSL